MEFGLFGKYFMGEKCTERSLISPRNWARLVDGRDPLPDSKNNELDLGYYCVLHLRQYFSSTQIQLVSSASGKGSHIRETKKRGARIRGGGILREIYFL